MMLDHVPILLAEDNENDVYIMRRAFSKVSILNPLLVVKNGRDAVDYLAGKGAYAQRDKHPLPGLMLLDLKMPWMDGFDVLRWLRRRAEFSTLPVVILTSSRLQSDLDQSRLMGVYDYRVKPQDFAELVVLVEDICRRWLSDRASLSPATQTFSKGTSSGQTDELPGSATA